MTFDDFCVALGNRIRELRVERKLNQEDVVDVDLEISTRNYVRIENGQVNATLKSIYTIANQLKVHPKELFDFEFTTPRKSAGRRRGGPKR